MGGSDFNATNKIGLGGICRGSVWKSGLFRFSAAVSQPSVVWQHSVTLCWCWVLGLRAQGAARSSRAGRGLWSTDQHQELGTFLVLRG